MKALRKHNLLGVLVSAVDYEDAVSQVISAAKQKTPYLVAATAVHGLMLGALDRKHQYRLNRFDLLTPDGQPVRWALNGLYRTGLADRVYGPNLMLRVCREAAEQGLPVLFFGGDEAMLSQLNKNLLAQFPNLIIADSIASEFRRLSDEESQGLARRIQESGAAIVFVGIGCPRQEIWAFEHRHRLSLPVLAVGAAFPFHAGRLAQAPSKLQRWGLEWLFRLVQEPRRLWRRYLLLNPLFIAMLSLQAFGFVRFDPSAERPPEQELNYG